VGPGGSRPGVALEERAALVAQFPADAVGVHLEVLEFAAVAGAPYVLEDHPPGADLAGVAGEVGEQLELPRVRSTGAAVERGLVAEEVEAERAGLDFGGLRVALAGRLVAECDPQPGVEFPHAERVYVTMYGLTLLAIRLLGSALDAYARHAHLYSPVQEDEELHSTQRKFLPAVISYVIAIRIGLALPAAAVVLYFGLAVYLVVPFREAARVLRRRHSPHQ
jgi:hypothetical protein